MDRDGQVFKIGDGPRPPAHLGCRCTTVPITKSFREMGFDVDDLPPGTRASMNGQVPATLKYPEWLRRQTADVQNEALGLERAKLFRNGEVEISNFTNRAGRRFTLDELRQRERI